jgi:molecular chaperone DnaK (HSP70)
MQPCPIGSSRRQAKPSKPSGFCDLAFVRFPISLISNMSEARYLVGIDLGTSNCALAFVEPAQGPDAPVRDFPITQLVRPAEAAARPLLPSCIYIPGPHELSPEAMRLPWAKPQNEIVGEFARWQGARVPNRLVASAKSWLCSPSVDRCAPILPWGAPAEVNKLSPVDAAARLLQHMKSAWDTSHPDAPLAQQEVIITVPASFDEAARALTVNAAKEVGFDKFTLVEEPQAAFYDFTARHRSNLDQVLEEVRLVLVVDVGGGTSDFTLVRVAASPGGPLLDRIAVGEHLMLGGDNMDAALSRSAEQRMVAAGKRLSSAQWQQLTQAARVAKETLLAARERTAKGAEKSESSETRHHLSVVTEGSRLVGGSLSTHITRSEAEQIILDGFFPRCPQDDAPRKAARAALQEFGLPYAQDPAITRHLAAFLRAHAAAGFAALGETPSAISLPRPDAVLLNGGVFNSPVITQRLLQALSAWWPDKPPLPLLHHDSLDLAVARGAAFYGLVRRGLGRRIGGGAAHALYVGLEKTGTPEPVALCVIPRGQEEGATVELGDRLFQLALGKPVRFPLYSSASDRLERAGEVTAVNDDMRALPPIHTLLKDKAGKTGTVPVHLRATLTELGTLELWCVSNVGKERWRLEFELRSGVSNEAVTETEAIPAGFADARRWIGHIFGRAGHGAHAGSSPQEPATNKASPPSAPPKEVKQLWNSLERTLGPREEWRLPVLRELWGVLMAGSSKRRRSADHERIFFQLLGYTLRPGFGYALDEWRCEQSARLFSESVQFHNDKACWKEFWILWRRLAGGLSEAHHQELWTYLKPHLALRVPPQPQKHLPRPKGISPEGLDEMTRLAAALEHLPATEKAELGTWITARLKDPATAGGPWMWALGRLGSRAPIYGSVHKTLTPSEAEEWIRLLLRLALVGKEGALFALAQLARLTGDRTRDVDEQVRLEVLAALKSAEAPPSWQHMVTEIVTLGAADKARALGDTLPAGLRLD